MMDQLIENLARSRVTRAKQMLSNLQRMMNWASPQQGRNKQNDA